MKLLNEVKSLMSEYGYRKKGDSFWKIENGFYKLIHFQKGAYGDYFFINVALHPNGLPMLSAKLELIEKPKEYCCALRQRVEQITTKGNSFHGKLGYPEEAETVQALLSAVLPDLEAWLNKWGSYETILSAPFDEMVNLFTVPPLFFKKEFWLLKCYAAWMTEDAGKANEYFSAYQQENPDRNFSLVDQYMYTLLTSR